MTSLATLPGFATHFLAGLVLLALGIFCHVRMTPQDDMRLIREGNTAAAITVGGALIGLALPIAAAISNSANLLDAAVWGLVALIAQLLVFLAVAWVLGPRWREALERGETAGAVVKAAAAIAVGLLNAAAMSS